LQAYGLIPGDWVYVVQQKPVTVVQIEHLELALEGDLARQVEVAEVLCENQGE
jgi:Fe2+ transport system protein FeoA